MPLFREYMVPVRVRMMLSWMSEQDLVEDNKHNEHNEEVIKFRLFSVLQKAFAAANKAARIVIGRDDTYMREVVVELQAAEPISSPPGMSGEISTMSYENIDPLMQTEDAIESAEVTVRLAFKDGRKSAQIFQMPQVNVQQQWPIDPHTRKRISEHPILTIAGPFTGARSEPE